MGGHPGFIDRSHAGSVLADAVLATVGQLGLEASRPPVVLGLARGGVPVAAPVARALGAELDALVVRKVGVPGHRELAMGAIAAGGVLVRNDDVLTGRGIDEAAIARVVAEERERLDRLERELRGDRPPVPVAGRAVLLVDDGLATGATMRAAVAALRIAGATDVVGAAPVGAPEACAAVQREAEALVCPLVPERFVAVGSWYERFGAVEVAEVQAVLGAAGRP